MKYYHLLCLLIPFICCCSEHTTNENKRQLQASDSVIHIAIAPNISCTSRNIRYFSSKGREYLAVQNAYKGLSIYSLENCSLVKDIFPQIEGPDGIDSPMAGFDIINFDSIFLLTDGIRDRLVIIDSAAHVIKKIKFDISYQPYFPLTNLWSSYGQTINCISEKLIVGSVCMDTEDSFFKNHKQNIAYCYDTNADSVYSYPLKFPDLTKQKMPVIYSGTNILVHNNRIVLSYSLGHQVFVSTKDGLWITYVLKSKYAKKTFDPGFSNDMMEGAKKFVESPYYLALVYDKYRKVYYRFVYPGIDVTRQDDVMKLGEFRRVFSVMIIDEDFNVLGETLMPENTYNSNMFFVNEAGLWISTNHPGNPDFDEDAINFQLFTLK